MSESARYRADDLRKFCCAALQALEVPPLDAEEVSECLEGQAIPADWAIAADGNPTTDANAALAGSVLLFAGAKASAISFIIDIEILRMLKSSPAVAATSLVLVPGELERQNEAGNRIFGIPLVPGIVEQLAELGESLGLAFPNAADSTDLAETPA